jgi:hypothetical protein
MSPACSGTVISACAYRKSRPLAWYPAVHAGGTGGVVLARRDASWRGPSPGVRGQFAFV